MQQRSVNAVCSLSRGFSPAGCQGVTGDQDGWHSFAKHWTCAALQDLWGTCVLSRLHFSFGLVCIHGKMLNLCCAKSEIVLQFSQAQDHKLQLGRYIGLWISFSFDWQQYPETSTTKLWHSYLKSKAELSCCRCMNFISRFYEKYFSEMLNKIYDTKKRLVLNEITIFHLETWRNKSNFSRSFVVYFKNYFITNL